MLQYFSNSTGCAILCTMCFFSRLFSWSDSNFCTALASGTQQTFIKHVGNWSEFDLELFAFFDFSFRCVVFWIEFDKHAFGFYENDTCVSVLNWVILQNILFGCLYHFEEIQTLSFCRSNYSISTNTFFGNCLSKYYRTNSNYIFRLFEFLFEATGAARGAASA